MILRIFAYLLVVIPFLFSELRAQQPHAIQYTTDNGLPSNTCYDILQDSKGRIWFGTEKGVVRYNGSEFKTFTVEDGLFEDEVLVLYEDTRGRIWMSSYNQWPVYFEDGQFHRLDIPDSILAKNTYRSAYVELNGVLYIGSLEIRGDSWVIKECELWSDCVSRSELPLGYREIYGFLADSSEVLISGCETNCGGLPSSPSNITNEYRKRLVFNRLFMQVMKTSCAFFANDIRVEDGFWFLSDSSTSIRLLMEFMSNLPNGEPLYKVVRMSENVFYCATGAGIFEVHHQKEKIIESKHIFKGNTGSLLKSREGDIWVTTLGNGIFLIPSPNFKTIKIEGISQEISGVGTSTEGLVVGDNSGKMSLGGKVVVLPEQSGNFLGNFETNSYFKVSGNEIHSGEEIASIIISSAKQSDLYKAHVYDFLMISNDEYYVGNTNGVLHVSREDTTYILDEKSMTWQVAAISLRRKGDTLLIGNKNGLFGWRDSKLIDFGEKDKNLRVSVAEIEYEHDKYWLATSNSGILIWDEKKLLKLTKDQGLSSNNVYDIIVESENSIWCRTKEGLDHVTFHDGKLCEIHTYNKSNGLPCDHVNSIFMRNDTLWVGTNKGLAYVQVSTLNETSQEMPFNVNSVKINGADTTIYSEYSLEYNQRSVEFEYEGVNYESGGEITYHYRVIGVNDEWIETDQKSLAFNALPYGDYLLEIWAEGQNNARSQVNKISISIAYPLWLKWWMILLEVLVGGLLISFLIQKRITQVTNRKQRMIELELNSLRAQMNPHFIFNALVSLKESIRERDFQAADTYLGSFSKLMRQILNSTRNDFIELDQEIEILEFYLQLEQQKSKNFDFEVIVSEELEKEILVPPMILQPFIENCLVHAFQRLEKRGMIKIEFMPLDDKFVFISIEDNGIGRYRASQLPRHQVGNKKRAVGILASGDRLRKLSEFGKELVKIVDLYDDSGHPKGTRIEIKLPYQGWS